MSTDTEADRAAEAPHQFRSRELRFHINSCRQCTAIDDLCELCDMHATDEQQRDWTWR